MPCFHPIKAWQYFKPSPSGKKDIVFHINPAERFCYKEIELPCGQCIGCRLDYSKQWAARIMCEAQSYDQNWFVTLTYDDLYLPHKSIVHLDTGELIEGNPLVPEHLTKFMKDLRRYFEYHYNHTGIRFYAAGEYGDLSGRPHYHLCVFNLPLDGLLEPFFFNKMHQQIYKCPVIAQIWQRGLVSVGELTFQSAAYVARYVLKKRKGKDSAWYYESKALVPEFTRMSRRPGIGRDYYEAHKEEIYKTDTLTLPKGRGSITLKPPKYYDGLYDLDSPEAMAAIKADREFAAVSAAAARDLQSTLTRDERRAILERTQEQKALGLIRSIE